MRGILLGCCIFLLFPVEIVCADTKFKIEMQNYTDAELKFYCKSITGSQKWVFPRGSVSVPSRSSVTEDVVISRASQGVHEEIQCTYLGKEHASRLLGSGTNQAGVRLRVLEKTTDSIAVDASFGGVLTLVVNPLITQKLPTEHVLDTHSEFMVSFEN